MLISRTGYHNL